jgi:Mce-associated membrane protein
MTRSLVPHADDLATDDTELQLAEAEAVAATAEAEAARARAEAARAQARLARLRRAPHSARTATAEDPSNSAAADETRTGDEPGPADAEMASGSEAEVAAEAPGTTDEAIETDETVDSVITADVVTSADDSDESSVPQSGRLRRAVGAARRRLPAPRRPSPRALAVTVMSMVAVGALVVAGYFGMHHRAADDERTRADDFTAAADRGVTAITSLDFRNAKRDVQRIVDQSTGEFYNDFKNRADDFTSVIEQSQVTTKGKVTSSAVESMNDSSAVVLVSASSDVTNAAGAQQEPRTWRLRVTVSDDGGTMKISKVDFVP